VIGAFKPSLADGPIMTDEADPESAEETEAANGSSEDEDGHDETPPREEFHHDPVSHARVRAGMTVGELASEYSKAGIGAADLAAAIDIYAEMIGREDVTNFVGLAGAMVPAGMREIVAESIRDGHVDVLVTTGATLTHDTIEAIGGKHHHGHTGSQERRPRAGSTGSSEDSPEHGRQHGADSSREHDERLRDEGVDRIYNVYLPQEHFTLLEDHARSAVFPTLEGDGAVGIEDLTAALGRANAEHNAEEDIEEDAGIAAAAYECGVPIYAPAIQDSVLGLQAWMYSQIADFSLDALADMRSLTDLAFEAERAGALVIGGGVPKNYTLQTMLVAPDAYDYAVQLTMDPEHTGGLSGATLDEARSWGKLEKAARNASVYADATITYPLLVAAAREQATD
jgi:deoxyhypusine synthase